MAKVKTQGAKSVPNKHLHARTTFLYQAATYLALQAGARKSSLEAVPHDLVEVPKTASPVDRGHSTLAVQLGSHLQAVSLKGQVHLSADVKRSVCKVCNAILIPGRTSKHTLENKSRGGKKPWADVLLIECIICGSKKRFPVGATRQQRKTDRRELANSRTCSSKEADDFQSTPFVQTTAR